MKAEIATTARSYRSRFVADSYRGRYVAVGYCSRPEYRRRLPRLAGCTVSTPCVPVVAMLSAVFRSLMVSKWRRLNAPVTT